jgi:tetratricopeptide (TPR) repeat protein
MKHKTQFLKANFMNNSRHFRIVLYFLTFILSFLNSYSQEKTDATAIETTSFQLFTDKNWDALIVFGNEAIKNGNDYFYLRERVGIAYYEKQNYSLAAGHFKNALQFNATDDVNNEYLYYCYIFLGKDEEARKLSTTFSSELKTKLELKNPPLIDFIVASGGTKMASSPYSDSKKPIFFKPATFFELGFKHYVLNKFSLFHSINTFSQETFLGKINQNQYYLLSTIPLKNNWSIAPAIHLFQVNLTNQIPFLRTQTTSNTNFVGSFSVKKSIRKFDFTLGSTFLKSTSFTQYNHFSTISYAVLGNSKLILGITDYLHNSNLNATFANSISPFVYFQPLSFASVKLSYLQNNIENIIEENGYLVNNSPDLTMARYSALANFRINKTVSLFAMYQQESKKELAQRFDYQYGVVLGGIKLNNLF